MQNSLWTITSLRHTALAALAAGSVITLSASAQAQDASPGFAAPLDTGWSTYTDFIEYPDFLPSAPRPHAFSGLDTTGVNSAPAASDDETAAADKGNADYPDDIYKFAP